MYTTGEQMQRYKNLSGELCVVAYEISDRSITIKFRGGESYLYTQESAGRAELAEMQRRARAGQASAPSSARSSATATPQAELTHAAGTQRLSSE